MAKTSMLPIQDTTILHNSLRLIVARWIAAGLGSGWTPFAPGTFGSLAALIVAWFVIHGWGLSLLWMGWVLLLPVACWSTYIALPAGQERDPGWVVIDEWLGQWLTLLMVFTVLPVSLTMFVLAFAAFRFFDILKPYPIKMVEHIGADWWSIHADDLVAGLFAGLTLLAGNFMVSVV